MFWQTLEHPSVSVVIAELLGQADRLLRGFDGIRFLEALAFPSAKVLWWVKGGPLGLCDSAERRHLNSREQRTDGV